MTLKLGTTYVHLLNAYMICIKSMECEMNE